MDHVSHLYTATGWTLFRFYVTAFTNKKHVIVNSSSFIFFCVISIHFHACSRNLSVYSFTSQITIIIICEEMLFEECSSNIRFPLLVRITAPVLLLQFKEWIILIPVFITITHTMQSRVSAENLSGWRPLLKKRDRFNERDVRICACAEDNTVCCYSWEQWARDEANEVG
jgi:hypothetical protein